MPTKSPVTVRLDDEHRLTLESLAADSSPSDVLRRGLRMVASAERAANAPLHPRLVSEDAIVEVIERAAQAACEVLDELFEGHPKERGGISSNFVGTLQDHLEAMLTGKEASHRSYSRELNALFGDWRSLGRLRAATANEGFSIMLTSDLAGAPPLFFHSDRQSFVELHAVGADTLYTSEDAARRAVFDWMRKNAISPRAYHLRLCLLAFGDTGPLTVAEVAAG